MVEKVQLLGKEDIHCVHICLDWLCGARKDVGPGRERLGCLESFGSRVSVLSGLNETKLWDNR